MWTAQTVCPTTALRTIIWVIAGAPLSPAHKIFAWGSGQKTIASQMLMGAHKRCMLARTEHRQFT